MRKIANGRSKRIVALLLAIMLAVTMTNADIYAAGIAQGSTEAVDSPEEETVNAEVYFVLSATKKVITLNGTELDPIDCNVSYDANNIPDNGKFKVYYGKGTTEASKDATVVNFTCDVTNTSWKSDNDDVFQMGTRTNPSGWESVQMEPQGDGTVAFRSCANDKLFSVQDGKMVLIDDDEATSNEKFVLYTDTAPKAAKKVTLSEVAGDSLTVSWEGVDECLFSGYEVLYSTSENGIYTVAGATSNTSFKVNNLNLNTRYYFKVRTITNNDGGPYTDSAKAYVTTLSDYKPAAPTYLTISENDDGSIKVGWAATNSVKGYKIYKAESRFAEYTEIADVGNAKSYIDNEPNSSKYNNYYKIQAYNDVDVSELSEAISIEISMFGENTYIFNETDDVNEINAITDEIFEKQHYSQFGDNRYALAFKPGDYTSTDIINVGYYTQILGLGKTPYDVQLYNVHAPAALSKNNATCNFWVGIENVMIKDMDQNGDAWFNFRWSVSQAAPARRLYVERTAQFDWQYGWASGGFVADSYFEKQAGSYPQQQYYYRNSHINEGAYGINWNQVIQGCTGVTAENTSDNTKKPLTSGASLIKGNGITNWNQRGCTTIINNTPIIREKPFLYFDVEENEYKVFVPALRENSVGVTWSYENMGEGTSLSVDKSFYIANPDVDTAESINAQISSGKNIIFRPGIYHVSEPIEVTRANTILLGMGIASIIPDNEEAAIKVSDVGGVSIAGLILDAGNYSETLLTIGEEGCNKDHSDNPIVLQDVIFRVGGTGNLGRTNSCLVINSNDTIIDHTWIWRADHGEHTGWYENTAKNGLIVNGDNVTAYGLFCEHFQEYDIIWRGEYGTTYFLQNEKCYDPQNQDEWMSHNGTKKGYAAYKVTNNVKNHYAVGLGIYDVFINTNGASIFLDNAIEVPDTPNVLIENACIVEIANGEGPLVGINHIVNNTTAGIKTGADSNGGYAIQRLLSYCNNESLSLPDYYEDKNATEVQEEEGEKPLNDVTAEKEIVKEEESKDEEILLWETTDEYYNNEELKTMVQIPTAIEDLVYNGDAQTGVVETSLYTVENNVQTEAGTYVAKVTLNDPQKYQWNKTFDGNIQWTIAKKGLRITGIEAADRDYEEGNILVDIFGGDVTGIAAGDETKIHVSIPAKGKLASDGIGENIKVDVPDIEIEGEKKDNYIIENVNEVFVTIKEKVTTEEESGEEKTEDTTEEPPTQNDDSMDVPSNNDDDNTNQSGGDTSKPSDNQSSGDTSKPSVYVGKKIRVGKYKYKITKIKGKKGNVTLTGVKKKYRAKLKKAVIKKSIRYKGYTFKVTAIGKKAFVKCRKLNKITVKGKNLKFVSKKAFYKKTRKKLKVKAKKKVKKIILKSINN